MCVCVCVCVCVCMYKHNVYFYRHERGMTSQLTSLLIAQGMKIYNGLINIGHILI